MKRQGPGKLTKKEANTLARIFEAMLREGITPRKAA